MKSRSFKRLARLPLVALLCFVALGLAGCTDQFVTAEQEPAQEEMRADKLIERLNTDKLRHAHLFERATRKGAPGKFGNETSLNLVISIGKQSAIERYAILEQYKNLERYEIIDRYEYDELFGGYAITIEDSLGLSDYWTFLDSLALDPDVMWFEPDFSVTLPIGGASPGGLGQQIPWSVLAIGGGTSSTVSGDGTGSVDGVDLYILDTGVSHSDLNIVESLDFRDSTQTLIADPTDYDGHGTHVAGIAAAIDDLDGLVGVAPGLRVHNLKVLDDNGTTDVSVVLAALEHVLDAKKANPAQPMVVNMSLGEDIGTSLYTALDEAVATLVAEGIVVVVAAGNQGIDTANVTPAHALEAITVGAYDVNGLFATFSNYGPMVDLLAPGANIISLAPNAANPVSMSGTSMAAPHVAGAAALYLSAHPTATPSEVIAALQANAHPIAVGTPAGTTDLTVWVGN